MFQFANKFIDNTSFFIRKFIFHIRIFHCGISWPDSVFQDVSMIYERKGPFVTLSFFEVFTALHVYGLDAITVGVTVWYLSISSYILVSSLCFPHLCPVSLSYIVVLFQQSTHCFLHSILLYFLTCQLSVNISIVFCYNYRLVKYILQLFFCFHLQFLHQSVSISMISVFATNLFLCFL